MLASHEPVVEVLYAFFAAMNEWEVETYDKLQSIYKDPDADEAIFGKFRADRKLALMIIYEKFCAAGSSAKRLLDEGLSCGNPPKYDPNNEKLMSLEVKGNIASAFTQQNFGFNRQCKYWLVYDSEKWLLLDKRQTKHRSSTKFTNSQL